MAPVAGLGNATVVDEITGCAFGDRHCTVSREKQSGAVVWVGPHDGRWIRVVDKWEVEPSAPRPCAPFEVDRSEALIFAAIASFRDSLCSQTLVGLFGRARYPDRIRAAVVQQNDAGDDDCLEAYCRLEPNCRRSQVAIKRFHSSEAKGPTWARAQDADMLPEDAEFCLRTDSHMAFARDWDVKSIEQWSMAENEFAVISTYVADATQIKPDGTEVNVNSAWEVPHLCSIQWQGGHVRNMQAKAARNLARPKLTTLWAAGLSFSKCHAERAVPYDPETPYIFWGEEFSRTARFFTQGYDVYTPHRTIVAHDYKHTQGDPTHFKWNGRGGPRIDRNATIQRLRDASNKRIWSLLGMPGGDPEYRDFGRYGLGHRRSLDQLVHFTGIRLANRTTFANRCGNIDWVQWDCRSAVAQLEEASPFSLANTRRQKADETQPPPNAAADDDDPLNDALAAFRIHQRDTKASPTTAAAARGGNNNNNNRMALAAAALAGRQAAVDTAAASSETGRFSLFLAPAIGSCCCLATLLLRRRRRRKRRPSSDLLSTRSYHLTKVV